MNLYKISQTVNNDGKLMYVNQYGVNMKKKIKKPKKNETINQYVARTGEPFPITKKQLKEFERMIKDRSYDIKIPSKE